MLGLKCIVVKGQPPSFSVRWNDFRTFSSSISHFLDHAQNKVRVSVRGLTRFVNMTGWMKKVKRSIITERIDGKTSKVSQNIVMWDCAHD